MNTFRINDIDYKLNIKVSKRLKRHKLHVSFSKEVGVLDINICDSSVSYDYIVNFLKSKQARLNEFAPKTGLTDIQHYLGVAYELIITTDRSIDSGVTIDNINNKMIVNSMCANMHEYYLYRFYERETKRIVEPLFKDCKRVFTDYTDIDSTYLDSIKKVISWNGRCSYYENYIEFSGYLCKKPMEEIKQTVLHEFCHLRVHTHGAVFSRELNKRCNMYGIKYNGKNSSKRYLDKY